jgi:hypothetical protein
MELFNIAPKPFRIRREVLKLLSSLLMSALSLQFRQNNETLFINRPECSTTQL